MGRNSNTTITFDDDDMEDSSWLRKIFKGVSGDRVKISGKGRGLKMWADVQILVPEGRRLNVKLGAGDIAAEDVAADLNLDTASGPIKARNIDGKLLADTGSGAVDVSGIHRRREYRHGQRLGGRPGLPGRQVPRRYRQRRRGCGRHRVSGVAHRHRQRRCQRPRTSRADRAKIDTGSGLGWTSSCPAWATAVSSWTPAAAAST